jgi:hypothetical protein
LSQAFDQLWQRARGAFGQQRSFGRARLLALSGLLALGRRTVTGMLATAGLQFRDWSANYRLFERQRFDLDALFAAPRQAVCQLLDPGAPMVAIVDDTLLRKTGKKTHGAAWRRDPLGPKFRPNFAWAQRFLQVSAVLPQDDQPGPVRAIPIDFQHCPTPAKPKKNAPPQDWQAYRQTRKQTALPARAAQRLAHLRDQMDRDPNARERLLISAVDGGYTNGSLVKHLPDRTVLVGRIRKDAKIFQLPDEQPARGRRRRYGPRLPTPDEIRRDSAQPWTPIRAWVGGAWHELQIKVLRPLRWASAGGQKNLCLVIVQGLNYRLAKHSSLLHRQPLFLICTDPDMAPEQIAQIYLWRWEIEVNFRDEKTLVGVGQAQVRTPQAVQAVPALLVVAYAFLLIAARQCRRLGAWAAQRLPLPKWRNGHVPTRLTTAQLLSLLRAELWGDTLGLDNFTGFDSDPPPVTKPRKSPCPLVSAVLYAT